MICVTYYSRKKFYHGKDIYWYKIIFGFTCSFWFDVTEYKFLKIEGTDYYEYGGTHEEALEFFKSRGITDIRNGGEL